MQLYEDSKINNEIRNTYEYPTIKNLLISNYKVDTKNASNKAQSITNQLLNDKDYQTLKAKKQANSRDISSDNYLKKFVGKVMANYKGKQQSQPAAQPTENQAQTKTDKQPQNNQNTGNASTNNENVELLNILNNQTQTYNQVLQNPNEIQYLSLDDSGNPSYDKSNFDKEVASISSKNPTAPEQPSQKASIIQEPQNLAKQNESLNIFTSLGITLPKFLSRYLEANNKNDAFYSILSPEVSSKLKSQNIHVIGIYKDPKTKKWIAIDSSGTKRDISQLKGENLNNEEILYDIKLEDSDINAIEKSILPIISDKKVIDDIKFAIKTIFNIETPFNLKLQLGKVLNESLIQKYRYRLNEGAVSQTIGDIASGIKDISKDAGDIAKKTIKNTWDNVSVNKGSSKQFYVLFEISSDKSESENKEKIKKAEENNPKESKDPQKEDKVETNENSKDEEKKVISNLSEIDDKQIIEIAKTLRTNILAQLEKLKHRLGPKSSEGAASRNLLPGQVKFKLTKTIQTKDGAKDRNVHIILTEGDDSYIDKSKTDDIISGKFTLKATLNKSTKLNMHNIGKGISSLSSNYADSWSKDASGVTL